MDSTIGVKEEKLLVFIIFRIVSFAQKEKITVYYKRDAEYC